MSTINQRKVAFEHALQHLEKALQEPFNEYIRDAVISHTYDEALADRVYAYLKSDGLSLFQTLEEKLSALV